MTLHALRREIGDRDFFRLVKRWVRRNAGGNVTTPEFIALAERISGRDPDAFFRTWLFTPAKPAGIEPAGARALAGRGPRARPAQARGRRGEALRPVRP